MNETETGGKWTQGPWQLFKDDDLSILVGPRICGPMGTSDDIKMCSRWIVGGWKDDPEALANMRLMAASPAMAEALEKAIPVLLSAHENDASVVSWSALESARAALSKAKGGE